MQFNFEIADVDVTLLSSQIMIKFNYEYKNRILLGKRNHRSLK